jgi:hypothetical protein
MARAAWPWTLVVVLAAFLVAATVATAGLILLVRGLSSLRRSAHKRATPDSWRPSSNGFRADRDPRSPLLDGNERGEASPRRQPPQRRPPA